MSKAASFGLFLGDLSLFCNEEDLRLAFQPYGHLVEVRIKRSKENKKNLSYGFVEYSSPIEAIRAMQAMDGKIFCGRTLKVRWAAKKQGPGGRVSPVEKTPKDAPGTASIYVSFTCYNAMGDVTEETLRAVFEKFGEVVDVTIKFSAHDDKAHLQKGYGFVSYREDADGYAAVLAALHEMGSATRGTVSYKCELSRASKQLLEGSDGALAVPAAFSDAPPQAQGMAADTSSSSGSVFSFSPSAVAHFADDLPFANNNNPSSVNSNNGSNGNNGRPPFSSSSNSSSSGFMQRKQQQLSGGMHSSLHNNMHHHHMHMQQLPHANSSSPMSSLSSSPSSLPPRAPFTPYASHTYPRPVNNNNMGHGHGMTMGAEQGFGAEQDFAAGLLTHAGLNNSNNNNHRQFNQHPHYPHKYGLAPSLHQHQPYQQQHQQQFEVRPAVQSFHSSISGFTQTQAQQARAQLQAQQQAFAQNPDLGLNLGLGAGGLGLGSAGSGSGSSFFSQSSSRSHNSSAHSMSALSLNGPAGPLNGPLSHSHMHTPSHNHNHGHNHSHAFAQASSSRDEDEVLELQQLGFLALDDLRL